VALIDPPGRLVHLRIVYAGPAAGGKTTNLRQIAARVPASARGALVSIEATDRRTLLRDDLPIDLGSVGGWHVTAGLATVPGQPALHAERAAVIAGADAIVFVADSDPARQAANAESMTELRALLAGEQRSDLPLVLQINKQDLSRAFPASSIAAALGDCDAILPSVAIQGDGVFETLRAACKLAVQRL
jgi:mutual gliding-motility protein MglA